ncbi:MAG: FAD-dependent oxidoreductase [Candidatus Ranarchaeia archaeon]
MIEITLNGRNIKVEKNKTILEVANENKVKIPTLCYDKRLTPFDSCGLCVVKLGNGRIVRSCSTKVSKDMEITTENQEITELRSRTLGLLLSTHYGDCLSPCSIACPADVDPQNYLGLIRKGEYINAVEEIYRTLPFPASLGRICFAPCQSECRRNKLDDPLQICQLKRVAADRVIEMGGFKPKVKPAIGRKVAVIGGGPAGLSAAYYLKTNGIEVDVFEQLPEMGGMMRYGIPYYRLPRKILDIELDIIKGTGVNFKNNITLGEDIFLDRLVEDYDAVFLGIGAWIGVRPPIEGIELNNIYDAIHVLRDIALDEEVDLGKKVMVVGGGNTAIDAARSAIRLGAEVILCYRRSRSEMPASEKEIEEAIEEGVEMKLLTNPVSFSGDEQVKTVKLVKMELGEPDESGRRRPVSIKNSEFEVEVSSVVLATGQKPDISSIGKVVTVDKRNRVESRYDTAVTSNDKVFAGGDLTLGPSSAVEAIGMGKKAADSIIRMFNNEEYKEIKKEFAWERKNITKEDIEIIEPQEITKTQNKQEIKSLPAKERVKSFVDYEYNWDEKVAVTESARCLSCGCSSQNDCVLRDLSTEYGVNTEGIEGEVIKSPTDARHPYIILDPNKCILCGRCVRICDEFLGVEALGFIDRGFATEVGVPFDKSLLDSPCVSCGACIDTCPTGAIIDKRKAYKFSCPDIDVSSLCFECGEACEVNLELKNNKIIDINANLSSETSIGVLCALGRYTQNSLLNDNRIEKHEIKNGAEFKEISSEETVSQLSNRLVKDGSMTGILISPRSTNEEISLVKEIGKLIKAPFIGSLSTLPNVDSSYRKILGADISPNITTEIVYADNLIIIGRVSSPEHFPIQSYFKKHLDQKKEIYSIGNNPGLPNKFKKRKLDLDNVEGILEYIFEKIIKEKKIENPIKHLIESRKNKDKIESEDKPILDVINQIVDSLLGTEKTLFIYEAKGITSRIQILLLAIASLSGNLGKKGAGLVRLLSYGNEQGIREYEISVGTENEELFRLIKENKIQQLLIVDEDPFEGITNSELNKDLKKIDFITSISAYRSKTSQGSNLIIPGSTSWEKTGTVTDQNRIIKSIKSHERTGIKNSTYDFLSKVYSKISSQEVPENPLKYSHKKPSKISLTSLDFSIIKETKPEIDYYFDPMISKSKQKLKDEKLDHIVS